MSDTVDPELVDRFRRDLSRLWPELGSTDAKLGLAVSGGPDSMAMLLLAHAAIPGRFEVATVDHGLRPEARDECALVERACAERGIPCAVLSVEVGEGNVQAMAREARYEALGGWAADRKLAAVATAHHADDQAETILMRLNRASGIEGLAGIRGRVEMPFDAGKTEATILVIRPLLGFRRSELLEAVEKAGVAFATDPSNADARYDRVGLRQALRGAGWIDPAAFASSAGHLADAVDALEQSFRPLYEQWAIRTENAGEADIRLTLPPATPRYFALRALDTALRDVGGEPRGGDVARLLERLQKGEGGNVAGALVTAEADHWWVRREPRRTTT